MSKHLCSIAALVGLALASAVRAAPVPAPAAQSATVAAAIAAQRLPLERAVDGVYSGAGWRRLVEDAATADFTMVGEQHGSGSIAVFETALHNTLASRGYTHSVVEVGPHSTAFAEKLVRRGPGSLGAYVAAPGHGFALPFLFFAEEARMAEQMVALSPDQQQALWGVDQEFIGAGPIHVDILTEHARTPAQRAAVSAFSAASVANPLFAGSVGDAELGPLRAAFAEDTDVLRLLDSIAASSEIYRPFLKNARSDIYAANLARETMMKRNFLAAFTSAEQRLRKTPKVFLKFGGNHAMRGLSDTNVPAFANFLAEWGGSRGLRMVNLFVDCDGGQAMNPQTNKPETCEPYFAEDSALRQAVKSGPALQIYDLRPLRAQLAQWKDLDVASRKVILAFDYYVTIRGGRAATPLGSPPSMPKK